MIFLNGLFGICNGHGDSLTDSGDSSTAAVQYIETKGMLV